jgi:hypothetical protein
MLLRQHSNIRDHAGGNEEAIRYFGTAEIHGNDDRIPFIKHRLRDRQRVNVRSHILETSLDRTARLVRGS